MGDFDGDGIADVAFISNSAAIGIALGKGNGTFGLPTIYALTTYPVDFVVADLDRDGRLDIGSTNGTVVEVLWGEGDGTVMKAPLAQNSIVATVPGARSIIAENLDGTGALELVLADATGVTILKKQQYGESFPYATHVDITEAKSATAADVNGDGASDLLVPSHQQNGVVTVLLNDGNGAFGAPSLLTVGAYPREVIASKVDGNGTTDLIVAGADGIDVMLGTGNGQFSSASSLQIKAPYVNVTTGASDLDGDGLVDIVTTGFGGSPVGFIKGKGNGTFDAPVVMLGASYANGFDFADLNGDGVVDLVYCALGIGALINDGKGVFPGPATYATKAPSQLLAREMSGDGHMDLVIPDGAYLGKGNGSFSALVGSGFYTSNVTVADLDGDGKLDRIGPDYPTGIVIGLGDGKGSTATVTKIPLSFGVGKVAVADVTGDGKLDLITQAAGGLTVFTGDGKGGFASPITTPAMGIPDMNAVGDFNGDGRADVLMMAVDATLCLGQADGTFSVMSSIGPVFDVPDVTADLDGDGKLDLVSIRSSNYRMSVARGNGDGTFALPTFIYPGYIAQSVAVGDVDGDGKEDIVTGVSDLLGIAVMLGDGAGGFGAPLIYATDPDTSYQYTPNPVAVADFDGDGRKDVAGGRSILLNRGNVACGLAR